MSTRSAKEHVGFALEFTRVDELVVEGLHPAIRRLTTMRKPNPLIQRSSNTRVRASCSGVGVTNGFLLNMIVLFL